MRRELSRLLTVFIGSLANAARAALEEAQNILRIITVHCRQQDPNRECGDFLLAPFDSFHMAVPVAPKNF